MHSVLTLFIARFPLIYASGLITLITFACSLPFPVPPCACAGPAVLRHSAWEPRSPSSSRNPCRNLQGLCVNAAPAAQQPTPQALDRQAVMAMGQRFTRTCHKGRLWVVVATDSPLQRPLESVDQQRCRQKHLS